MGSDPRSDPNVDRAAGASSGGRGLRRLLSLWRVPTYRFAALFLSLLTGIALAYPAIRLRFGHELRALELFTARLVYALVSLVSENTRLGKEGTVSLGGFPVSIIDECTGIYEALMLSAALLAFPTSWGKTLVGFALGVPLIYAMNVLRIVMLLYVGRDYPRLFEFMHVYFWQVTMIAMVAGTWVLWVLWVVRDAGGGSPAEPETHRG